MTGPITEEAFDRLDDAEKLRRMEQALDWMNSRDRRIFLMHRVDDLSHHEIAEICRVSKEQVVQSMIRALAHLDAVLYNGFVPPMRKWWQFWKPR